MSGGSSKEAKSIVNLHRDGEALRRKGEKMKKHLYLVERKAAPGFTVTCYYLTKTEAEKLAKEATKEARKRTAHGGSWTRYTKVKAHF